MAEVASVITDTDRLALEREKLALEQEKLALDRNKLSCDILLKEHKNRFDEVVFHSARYHKQVNFFQLYMTVAGSFLAILFSKEWGTIAEHLSKDTIDAIKGTLITIAALIALYLFTNVMDALYAIYMNGRRIADIEEKVNAIIGRDLLTWDSKVIPRLYSVEKFFVGAWIRPNILVGVWSFSFFIFVSIGLCVSAYVFVNPFFYVFTPVMAFVSLVTLLNWFLLHREGLRYIDAAVLGNRHYPEQESILYVVIIGNICLGYFPMALFSLRDGYFWDVESVFAFCSSISVSVGDLLVMPFLLYYAILFIRDNGKEHNALAFLGGLLLSLMVNAYSHYKWVHDDILGFMDIAPGELSSAGIVHLVYSTIDMAIIFTFLGKLAHALFPKTGLSDAMPWEKAIKCLLCLDAFLVITVVDALIQAYRIHGSLASSGFSLYLPNLALTGLAVAATALVVRKGAGKKAHQESPPGS